MVIARLAKKTKAEFEAVVKLKEMQKAALKKVDYGEAMVMLKNKKGSE